jgi:hypothetical protein
MNGRQPKALHVSDHLLPILVKHRNLIVCAKGTPKPANAELVGENGIWVVYGSDEKMGHGICELNLPFDPSDEEETNTWFHAIDTIVRSERNVA